MYCYGLMQVTIESITTKNQTAHHYLKFLFKFLRPQRQRLEMVERRKYRCKVFINDVSDQFQLFQPSIHASECTLGLNNKKLCCRTEAARCFVSASG